MIVGGRNSKLNSIASKAGSAARKHERTRSATTAAASSHGGDFTTSPNSSNKRGSFILLEGVDRCGKTTQCSLLLKHLLSLSVAAVAMRFPDRSTPIGQVIDGYLKGGTHVVDDHSIHLLFSANRWEVAPTLAQTIADGTTIVCDRYAYSGVAFSSAKRGEDKSGNGEDLSIHWCIGPDVGLPAPDAVIFLDLTQDEAELRGGYGGERYEKRDLQIRVRQRFAELQALDEANGSVPWHIIDASKTIEEVQADIWSVVESTLKRVENGLPLYKMWEDGEYGFPAPSSEAKKN